MFERYELGLIKPTLPTFARLARVFKLSESEVYRWLMAFSD